MAAVSEPLVEPTLTSRSAWKTLENHSREARTLHRRDLFAGDPQRGGRMTAKARRRGLCGQTALGDALPVRRPLGKGVGEIAWIKEETP
jgi:hypothetical protein